MLFKDITLINEDFDVKEHQYVGVKDDRIAYIGDTMPTEDYGEIYNGNHRLLIPSFYNTHSHLSMALMRGYGENLPLMDWLQTRIFPFEGHLKPEDMYYGTLLGVMEMLRYGIGGTSEMYINWHAPIGKALSESGVKSNFSICCTCPVPGKSYFDLPIYEDTLQAIRDFDGYDNGRIHTEFSLHSEYLTTEQIVREMAETAKKHHSSMHIHVSESKGEVEECRARHEGRSPIRYLADCGAFNVPTVAAHCVHIDKDDMAILKEYEVTASPCPKSNLKLASGISPVSDLLKAGVNVSIGTDSVASNNNLNMLEEMRFFNLLQKRNDSTAITPAQTLYAATRAGAVAQRRMDSGFVKEGYKADLTVLDIDTVYMQPMHNLLNNLIYSAPGNDVVLTMVDGKVLYRDGEYPTLDTERILYECERSRKRILGEIAGA